jgi:ribose 1,5-bisphosphokinase
MKLRQAAVAMKDKGQLFLIVGNSGSGKDSLLREVLARWPMSAKPIRVPRRYITRSAHGSEQYVPVTTDEFEDLKLKNTFWLTWHVYGTDYGVPAIVLEWLNRGQHIAVNVSREIIPWARRRVPGLKVIFVSVPLEITLERIRSRRREAENDPSFQQRLRRAKENQTLDGADFIVDNSGPLDRSAEKLLEYLLSFG